MTDPVDSFIREVTSISVNLGQSYQETLDYWSPDDPPTTIVLSEIVHRFVDDFKSTDHLLNEAVLVAVENALDHGDDRLRTAVATGMIEGIVSRAMRIGIWDEVLPALGRKSASHAIAWVSP